MESVEDNHQPESSAVVVHTTIRYPTLNRNTDETPEHSPLPPRIRHLRQGASGTH